MPLTSPGNDDDTGENHQPTLRKNTAEPVEQTLKQNNFGQARAVVAGVERVVHFLVVSFPYSNMRWVVALPGETSECVCQGLLWIFERMGMAPRVVVFDNATGVGHRRPDGTAARDRKSVV